MVLCQDITVSLQDKSSFETTISQIQKYTQNILCVKNGEELLIYNNYQEIPFRLVLELGQQNGIYYFRSRETNDMYAFFGVKGERLIAPLINTAPRDTIIHDGVVSTSIHTISKKATIIKKTITY